MHVEQRIQELGKQIMNHTSSNLGVLNISNWSQSMINTMMDNESFRVASLRFTDVAPTLKNDNDFVTHLKAYFNDAEGAASFLGKGIPSGGLLAKIIAPLGRKNIESMAKALLQAAILKKVLKLLKSYTSKALHALLIF